MATKPPDTLLSHTRFGDRRCGILTPSYFKGTAWSI